MKMLITAIALSIALPSVAFAAEAAGEKKPCCCESTKDKKGCCDDEKMKKMDDKSHDAHEGHDMSKSN